MVFSLACCYRTNHNASPECEMLNITLICYRGFICYNTVCCCKCMMCFYFESSRTLVLKRLICEAQFFCCVLGIILTVIWYFQLHRIASIIVQLYNIFQSKASNALEIILEPMHTWLIPVSGGMPDFPDLAVSYPPSFKNSQPYGLHRLIWGRIEYIPLLYMLKFTSL